jgi:hypothetical protein
MMSDWWSYELSDLILFSSQTYYRLIELYNTAIWPLQLLTFVSGIALLLLVWRRPAWHGKAIGLILCLSWLWVAWAFHWQRFANIHWVASYFALVFIIQALLFVWVGAIKNGLIVDPINTKIHLTGVGLLAFSIFIQPFTMMVTGHKWQQAELFGVVPDPTVVASIGVLLLTNITKHWWLMIIPVMWCATSAATLWVLESVNALVMLIAGLAAISAFLVSSFDRQKN